MAWGWSSARGKILSGGWAGVLTYVITPELADEAVGDGMAWEMRLRSLPARLTLYFILGLGLFGTSSYREVIRQVTAGLEEPLAAAGWRVPASTALSAARARLGEAPLRSLFLRLRSALSPGRQPWSHVCGLLAVALDGTTVAVRDTPANRAVLGAPAASGGGPRLRLVALAACGTRALLDAAAGPAFGPGSGEQTMAEDLLGALGAGMLLLADRNFYSWRLWHAAASTGAGLLWRVSATVRLRPLAGLPDGSWLAHIDDPRAVAARHAKNGKRRRRGSPLPPDTSPLPGRTVRVIEYHLAVTADDGTVRTERYRLLTTLDDWREYPAAELAAAYARRWAIETCYLELKAYLAGPGRPLRGGTPALARQELWALLALYQALRTLIARAAASTGTDPGRYSFTTALHAARRTMTAPRRHLRQALGQAETEILASPVPERYGRVYPRAVKKPVARYPSRASTKTPISQHATLTLTITPATRTTPPPPYQHQQPQPTPNQPP
jgi:transposase IS4-like protein/DDE family transposase